jgi:hypothetical protein
MDKLSQALSFVALSLVLILAGCGGGGGGSSATNTGNGTGGTTPTTGTTGGTQVVTPTPVSGLPLGSLGYYDFYYLQDAGGTPASTTSTVVWSGSTYNANYYRGPATPGVGGTGGVFTLDSLNGFKGAFLADADVTIAQACPIVSVTTKSTNVLVEQSRTTMITMASGLVNQTLALYDCVTSQSNYNSLTVSATGVLNVSIAATVSTPAVNIVVTSADFTSMLGGKWRLMNGVYYSFNAFSFVDTGGATHYAIVMRGVPNLTGNTTGNAPNAFVSLWYK